MIRLYLCITCTYNIVLYLGFLNYWIEFHTICFPINISTIFILCRKNNDEIIFKWKYRAVVVILILQHYNNIIFYIYHLWTIRYWFSSINSLNKITFFTSRNQYIVDDNNKIYIMQ